MNVKQHTIKQPVTVSGVGLHTGERVNLTFKPADINHGIKFKRIDLPNQPIIDADVDNVVDVSRGTTLEQHGARVGTVEHVMAALVGLEVDNVMIELDNIETPIMDGSAILFIDALLSVGLEEQNAIRDFVEITENITYKDPERDVEIAALPYDDYRVTVMVDYNSHVLGSQHASLHKLSDFSSQIAACRTFCFLHEIEILFQKGLIKGGDLDNAIVVVDKVMSQEDLSKLAVLLGKPNVEVKKEGILNNLDLHFQNEPARHKLLDVIGDLGLIGKPLKCHILAARPGHAANVEFAKKVKQYIKNNKKRTVPYYNTSIPPLMNSEQIYQMLPHDYPFRLVDKIIHLDHNSVVGVKNVTVNEPFFPGHFPGNPVLPGVLLLETLAQVGAIFLLHQIEDPQNYWTYFLGIENCKFRKTIHPGDTVVMRCVLSDQIRRGIARMHGEVYVGDNLMCETDVVASLVKKNI